MWNALEFHLKSKVFNNAGENFESSVEYSSTEDANNVGKVKGTACSGQRLRWVCTVSPCVTKMQSVWERGLCYDTVK